MLLFLYVSFLAFWFLVFWASGRAGGGALPRGVLCGRETSHRGTGPKHGFGGGGQGGRPGEMKDLVK